MKLEVSTRCFRLTLEFCWRSPELDFRSVRPARLVPREASLRRKLFRNVRERLRK